MRMKVKKLAGSRLQPSFWNDLWSGLGRKQIAAEIWGRQVGEAVV